jgi:hypothetical protein
MTSATQLQILGTLGVMGLDDRAVNGHALSSCVATLCHLGVSGGLEPRQHAGITHRLHYELRGRNRSPDIPPSTASAVPVVEPAAGEAR